MQARGLAHQAHWSGLPTGQFFERFGAVPASPRAAYKLLKQGDSVLLFPGGGREVLAHVTQALGMLTTAAVCQSKVCRQYSQVASGCAVCR